MPSKDSKAATIAGLSVAAVGLSHFIRPQAYESLTRAAYPKNTRKFIYVDGALETTIGLGLAARRTRKLALAGAAALSTVFAVNVIRHR